MSQLRRNLFRRQLDNLLCRADDEDFCCMVWATRAIQSGRATETLGMLSFPEGAATSDLTSSFAIHPWKLETALNEILTVKKIKPALHGINRRMNCRQFTSIARVNNVLTDLENAEDRLALDRVGVIQEMHRLLQRQIEWQRPTLAFEPMYRSAYVFGGDQTKTFFRQNRGLSLDEFTLACFLMRMMFDRKPILNREKRLGNLGLTLASMRRAIDLLSLGHAAARAEAFRLRSSATHISYKPSLFRMNPCIAFGAQRERVCAPLPELITLRFTAGIFYDTITDEGNVRNEISSRFETYCRDLLKNLFQICEPRQEYQYKIRGRQFRSPDVVLHKQQEILALIECKATRMAHNARFSEQPFVEASIGYEQMSKGVFQIWRFVSHNRRRLLPEVFTTDKVRGWF